VCAHRSNVVQNQGWNSSPSNVNNNNVNGNGNGGGQSSTNINKCARAPRQPACCPAHQIWSLVVSYFPREMRF